MSAGTGISHSEFNASKTESVHLLQVWLLPAVRGLKPSYAQKAFNSEQKRNNLLPVASGEPRVLESNEAVHIHQDATFYLAVLEAGKLLTHELRSGRRAYFFLIQGALAAENVEMSAGDYAKISEEKALKFKAREPAEFLLIDLP
jgi:hypothetical protein